jgi:Asp-tRNA(Asn)/Glu-tRNA(Gln) amidotransferase A subunit family amidase
MKQFIVNNRKAVTGIAAALLLGLISMSFQDSPFIHDRLGVQEAYMDTTHPKCKNGMTMKEFDNLIKQMDEQMIQVDGQLKQIDFNKIEQDVEASLKNVQMDKIMQQVELSLKNIDLDKIMNDVKVSLKDVDWDKHDAEIKASLKDAKKEIEKAKLEVKDIDMTEVHKELEKAKAEIKNINMDKIMAEAKNGIDNAKEELKQTKAMFTEMENEKLINSKDGFSIEYKNSKLYINGKEQDATTTDKYRHYFKEDHFEINISKEKEN